jgi:CBS-domain-containing membrane protein
MLIDPRAKVHATTGILPTKDITLPSKYVDIALKNMEVYFRIDPFLTKIEVG